MFLGSLALRHLCCLQSLDITGFATFPSATLQELPQSLRKLSIRLDEIRSCDLPYLSPRLTECHLWIHERPATMTAEMARYWPLRSPVETTVGFEVQRILDEREAKLI